MRTVKVTESLGLTIKLADYEMARVDVSVEIEATNDTEDSMLAMANQARYQVRQELWESIQPFVGNWSPQRKRDLMVRLGVPLPHPDDDEEADHVAKEEMRRKLGL